MQFLESEFSIHRAQPPTLAGVCVFLWKVDKLRVIIWSPQISSRTMLLLSGAKR